MRGKIWQIRSKIDPTTTTTDTNIDVEKTLGDFEDSLSEDWKAGYGPFFDYLMPRSSRAKAEYRGSPPIGNRRLASTFAKNSVE